MNIPVIGQQEMESLTDYPELIEALHQAFSEMNVAVPLRHHHLLKSDDGHRGTMLLMPAWKLDTSLGVKLVNVFPENTRKGIPSIQGLYIHFNGSTGEPLCIMDAKTLTNKRTAATSALASTYLSRVDATSLLMLGTGSLAPELVKAHCSVRPIKQVFIWGRNHSRAQRLVEHLKGGGINCSAVEDYLVRIPEVDIISSATMSESPLIPGKSLVHGQHLDLVGSYLPHMREADDDCIRRSTVFVDTLEGATKESGDLVIPLQSGVLDPADIMGSLADLCSGRVMRKDSKEITLFKSVGYALEDLIAGEYYLKKSGLMEN